MSCLRTQGWRTHGKSFLYFDSFYLTGTILCAGLCIRPWKWKEGLITIPVLTAPPDYWEERDIVRYSQSVPTNAELGHRTETPMVEVQAETKSDFTCSNPFS